MKPCLSVQILTRFTVNLAKACHWLQDKRHCVTISNMQSCHAMTYSQHIAILINLLGFEHLIVIVSTFLHFNESLPY